MGRGALLSALLHVAVTLILVIGLPSFVSPPEIAAPIPVELVDLNQDQKPPEPKKAEPAPKPAPEPEPEPEERVVDAPPPPPAPPVEAPEVSEPEPEPEPEIAETPPEPEPEPLPEPEAEPEPEQVEETPPPKPQRKPMLRIAMPDKPEEPEEAAAPDDALQSIQKNVDKMRRKQMAQAAPSDETTAALAPSQASALAQNEIIRIIQSKMATCWRLEPGARNADDLIVVVRVWLNPNGSVRDVKIIDEGLGQTNRYYQTAAENARRAILRCQPFELPTKRYEIWRDMVLRFDPRQMFGG